MPDKQTKSHAQAKKERRKHIFWSIAFIFFATIAFFYIEFAYVIVPLVLGGALASFDLADRHGLTSNSLWKYNSVKLYVVVSSLGSVLLTQTFKVMGTKFVNNEIVDMFYHSIVGAGVFVKILPGIPVGKNIPQEGQEHLLTIRDRIYSFLEKCIERDDIKNTQNEIKEITDIWEIKDLNGRLRFSRQFEKKLDEIPDMDATKRDEIIVKVAADIADYDDYETAIRHLLIYYGIDFIKIHFDWCLKKANTENKES